MTSGRLPTGPDAVRGYRDNPFRVLGLPVDADPRAVSRRRQEFVLAAELGTVVPAPDHRLPLDGSPDAAATAQAYATWQDPRSRLVSELLWLWHADGGEPADDVDAIHDRAVTVHCEVLDLELPNIGRSIADPALRQRMDGLWDRAAVAWAEVLRDDRVWARLEDRAVQIDDPRLVPEDVTRLRAALPVWFLSINASLTRDGAAARLDGAGHRAVMHLFARSAGVDADAVDEALRTVTAGVLREVESACDAALAAVRADASIGCGQALELADRTEEPLAVLHRVLGAEHSVVEATRDRVAETMRRCVVRYVNAAPNSHSAATAHAVLVRAHLLAAAATSRRIFDDLLTIRGTVVPPGPRYPTPVREPRTEPGIVLPVVLILVGIVGSYGTAVAVVAQTRDQSGTPFVAALVVAVLIVLVLIVLVVLRRFR